MFPEQPKKDNLVVRQQDPQEAITDVGTRGTHPPEHQSTGREAGSLPLSNR